MGVKVKETVKPDGTHYSWCWVCPACDAVHQCDDRWGFNGSRERPTFEGSVLVHAVTCGTPDNPFHQPRCHSFVKDGQVSYCSDCTHPMAGQTVDLPDWDFALGLGGANG